MIHRLEVVTLLCIMGVEVNRRFSASPLRCGSVLSMRREMIAERCQQERTELPLGPVQPGQIILFKQSRKKTLRQILGFMDIIAFAADKNVKRVPVTAA